jgi:hypothetical protein
VSVQRTSGSAIPDVLSPGIVKKREGFQASEKENAASQPKSNKRRKLSEVRYHGFAIHRTDCRSEDLHAEEIRSYRAFALSEGRANSFGIQVLLMFPDPTGRIGHSEKT